MRITDGTSAPRRSDVTHAADSLREQLLPLRGGSLAPSSVAGLEAWLEVHANLLRKAPFCDIGRSINRVLGAGALLAEERDALLDWSEQFSNPDSLPLRFVSVAIARLHRFFEQLPLASTLSADHLALAEDWLRAYAPLQRYWPFDDVWGLLRRVISDGKISAHERFEVLQHCTRFADVSEVETTGPPEIEAPGQLLLASLYSDGPIALYDKSFCLAGPTSRHTATEVAALLERAGARVLGEVHPRLDYLVIGAGGDSVWLFAPYGRKVEQVLAQRRKGAGTRIIGEEACLEALSQALRYV